MVNMNKEITITWFWKGNLNSGKVKYSITPRKLAVNVQTLADLDWQKQQITTTVFSPNIPYSSVFLNPVFSCSLIWYNSYLLLTSFQGD